MNKKLILILYIVFLILFGAVFVILYKPWGPKEEYDVISSFKLESNHRTMCNSLYTLSELIDGKVINLSLTVHNQNMRDVSYSLLLLVNYRQIPFIVSSNSFSYYDLTVTKNGDATIDFSINPVSFCTDKINNLTIVIRQDIDRYSGSETLLRNSNTVCMMYSIVNDTSPLIALNTSEQLSNINDSIDIEPLNTNNQFRVLTTYPEDIPVKVHISGDSQIKEYVLLAMVGSEIQNINGDDLYLFDLTQNREIIVKTQTPEKPGIYNFEILAIPYGITDITCLGILHSNRFGIEVR